jgi:hypothetical protein
MSSGTLFSPEHDNGRVKMRLTMKVHWTLFVLFWIALFFASETPFSWILILLMIVNFVASYSHDYILERRAFYADVPNFVLAICGCGDCQEEAEADRSQVLVTNQAIAAGAFINGTIKTFTPDEALEWARARTDRRYNTRSLWSLKRSCDRMEMSIILIMGPFGLINMVSTIMKTLVEDPNQLLPEEEIVDVKE